MRARREQGVLIVTPAEGAVREQSTFTCCHCNCVTLVEARAAADDCGGFCRLCMRPTCKGCASGPCVPFERRLERVEARARLLASIGV